MGIEFLHDSLKPGKSMTLTFSDTVVEHVAGLMWFMFQFDGTGPSGTADTEHVVQRISLGLTSNMSGRDVTVSLNMDMDGPNGGSISQIYSSIMVGVIAITGQPNANIAMSNATLIGNQEHSPAIPLPGTALDISEAFLSGFDLSYSGSGELVRKIALGAGTSQSGTSGNITATAEMHDDSGHDAAKATIDGGYIAQAAGSNALLAVAMTDLQSNDSASVQFDQEIAEAIVFLQSANMVFPSEVKVSSIWAGYWPVKKSGKLVEISSPRVEMSGEFFSFSETQDDDVSSINVVVFAIPKKTSALGVEDD